MELTVDNKYKLRSATVHDAPALYKAVNESKEYFNKWLPSMVSSWIDLQSVENSIEKWRQGEENHSQLIFLLFQNDQLIGRIGLHAIGMDMGNHSRMITYWLLPDMQGKGIMTECVNAVIQLAFDTLDLNRLYVMCNYKNYKSRAIPERLGFVQEGILQDGEYIHGHYDDSVIYGMIKNNRRLL